MIGRSAPTNALPGIGIGLLLLIGPLQIGAEQLITRTFTQEDGLPDTAGMREVMQDSHGFIWIATHLGVSRFDGQQFQNYSLKDGLGYPQANRILETRSGEIWVSTNGAGVARYDPRSSAPRRFASYPTGTTPESNAVNSLHEGADGTLWASTDWGLYALKKGDTAFHLEFLPPRPPGTSSSIQAIIDAYSDGPDALWIASGYQGLYRRHADGSLDQWTDEGGGTFFHDRSGQLWLVTYHGALAIDRNARPGRSPVIRRLEAPTGGSRRRQAPAGVPFGA